MKIISLINSKGGVGKTTLCINLARYVQIYLNPLTHENKNTKVLLVDADPQGSLRDWYEAGGHQWMDMIAVDRKSAVTNLKQTNLNYDFVFIDTPGKIGDILAAAISISDLILIPVQPSPYDIWASLDTVKLIETRQILTPDGSPDCRYILNRCIPKTNISKDVCEHLSKSTQIHLDSVIYQRVIYAETAKNGNTIFESQNHSAIHEVKKLGEEMMEVISAI
jgi:chromosome partitioning protein